MWTLCNVRLKKIDNFPTEWVLKITSIEELIEYHKMLDFGYNVEMHWR